MFYNQGKQYKGGVSIIIDFLRGLLFVRSVRPEDAEYEPIREELRLAGLDEEMLRQMELDGCVQFWSGRNWISTTTSIWFDDALIDNPIAHLLHYRKCPRRTPHAQKVI